MNGGAVLSACGRYRYRLWRHLPASLVLTARGCVCWVMLNPSTADASKDDPTLRKCMGFSERWGYTELQVVNLFAWRSTEPRGLLYTQGSPVGADNAEHIDVAMGRAERVVLAWGRPEPGLRLMVSQRADEVRRHIAAMGRALEVGCLGRAQDGSPRHPLMLAYDTAFERVVVE